MGLFKIAEISQNMKVTYPKYHLFAYLNSSNESEF